jgi:hypothetical protein
MRFVSYVALAIVAAAAGNAGGQTAFDGQPPGKVPSGWTCGITGSGAGKWQIEADAQAASPPNVLTQRGRADFSWCVQEGRPVANGTVAVSFKPISGKEDQAGGVVWRFKGPNSYYVARGNALENNVSLYYVSRGVRHTLKYQSAPVARNAWHRLEVRFQGERIQVFLDGKSYIDLADRNISGPGEAGVWTKADSTTSFDDFQLKPID